jgi:3-oxoacyl-[acyl-carrier-protein] synthase II
MSRRRIVVTGLGIVSPVGSSLETAWSNVLAGNSGVVPITHYDTSRLSTRFAGLVNGFKVQDYLTAKEIRRTDSVVHFGLAAAKQALHDSGLVVTEANRERIGVCVGSGIGGLGTIEHEVDTLARSGPRRVSAFLAPAVIINIISGYISIDLNIAGPNLAVVAACATAANAIGIGARLIRYGDADVFLAGGAECASVRSGLVGFARARALSKRNDDPQKASRPWDRDRDGFVLGDGSGVLVLEEYEHARRRGARIYAELTGFGMSADAYHPTHPAPDGNGCMRSMQKALKESELNPEQLDYINAHGTSTRAGDLAETRGIKSALGEHAYRCAVSSTKSMTGHLLGAAGGIESIFAVLSLRDQVAPPTINLDCPGPGCDLDYVPHTAREMRMRAVMSNTFGFGGTNTSLVFKQLE